MKKFFSYAACLFAAVGFTACQQTDEPISVTNPTGEVNEWTLDVNLPDDMKTRAAASNSQGSDGLYTFSREIDKIWYAVYYENKLLYTCNTEEAPQAVKTGDKFTLLFRLAKLYDPTKVEIFFWAGNSEDNVTVTDGTTASGGINLNFNNCCVSVDPKYLNGNNAVIAEYDSYAGYFQLSNTKNVSNYNLKVTLKRPFAQIHVLSDEFADASVKSAYPNGIVAVPGFGRSEATSSNLSSEMVSPTTWFYDNSISLSPSYKQNEYSFTQTNYEFKNTLSNNWPERTTFKERDFHYLGCYLVFAPTADAQLKGASASGNTAAYTKLNLAVRKPGEALTSSLFKSVDIPAAGIKANNRYVVYNKKKTGDGDGGEGGGGFVSDSYAFEVILDNNWSGTTEIERP